MAKALRSRLFRATIFLAFLLATCVLISFVFTRSTARALTMPDWLVVATALEEYIDSQYSLADEGEAGFLRTAVTLKSQLDSNGDGVLLGEGDDASQRPVLIDVLANQTTMIPGTSYRIAGGWQKSADGVNAPVVRAKVEAHAAAGFSTDIVTYCLTGHAQSPVTMAYGAMSMAGYFTGGPAPRVEGLKWGRLGWGGTAGAPTYPSSLAVTGVPIPTPYYSNLAANAECSGVAPLQELVRCTASAALPRTGTGEAGIPEASFQPVSVMNSDVFIAHDDGSPWSYKVPLQNLFASVGGNFPGLHSINPAPAPAPVTMFYGRTQHSGLMAAQGAQMLGYNAKGLRWGLPAWNWNYGERWTGNPGYALMTVPSDGSGPDMTSPAIDSGPFIDSAPGDSIVISWTTDEPATSIVEWGTISGVYAKKVNDTILHSSHSVIVSGLPASDVYFRVISFDGNANYVASPEQVIYYINPDPPCPPVLGLQLPQTFWASYADYLARNLSVTWTIVNAGSCDACNIRIESSTNTGRVSLNDILPALVGSVPAAGSSQITLSYHVPEGISVWMSSMTASAEDYMGFVYTYP